jgi:hypothetical protein
MRTSWSSGGWRVVSNRDALLQHFQFSPNPVKGERVVQARDGKVVVHKWENCEPYIEAAKRLSEETPGKDFRHAAIIPDFVYDRAYREGWHNDEKAWKRWANSNEAKPFRTWKGRL